MEPKKKVSIVNIGLGMFSSCFNSGSVLSGICVFNNPTLTGPYRSMCY